MDDSLAEDADLFEEKARSKDLTELSKRDVQKWLFRVKRKLSSRYEFSVEGFEDDYEAKLVSEGDDRRAEFVVDRRGGSVEVNVFVRIDGETEAKEVWEQGSSV
ncbi:MAG: hypothetical protein SV760_01345 [Halobacteria archaeon]|nr:hypothetical protein [Halobacteria archaeon]